MFETKIYVKLENVKKEIKDKINGNGNYLVTTCIWMFSRILDCHFIPGS